MGETAKELEEHLNDYTAKCEDELRIAIKEYEDRLKSREKHEGKDNMEDSDDNRRKESLEDGEVKNNPKEENDVQSRKESDAEEKMNN